MVRILCLHGWATNTEIFDYQIQKLREEFRSEVEFVVLQALHEVPIQRDPVLLERFKGKYYAWINSRMTDKGVELVGLKESLEYIRKHVESSGGYDGIMGFSQGGAVAMLIVGMQNRGEFPGMFKFAVFVSPGFVPSISILDFVPRSLPVAFFLGKRDMFLPVGLSQVRCFRNAMVVLHDSGHRFPRLTKEVISALRSLLTTSVPSHL